MPLQPQASAVVPLCVAVNRARWVRYDDQHNLLFVGRITLGGGATVSTYDTLTGEPHDNPWPLAPEVVAALGVDEAFAVAVAERINLGY